MSSRLKNIFINFAIIISLLGEDSIAQPNIISPEKYIVSDNIEVETIYKFLVSDIDNFSYRSISQFKLKHSKNVLVHYPDGKITKGFKQYSEAMKTTFAFSPHAHFNTNKIIEGDGVWLSISGVLSGDFTEKLAIGDGAFVQPSGKRYNLNTQIIAYLDKNGAMEEVFLYWDNKEIAAQIGIGE